MSDACSSGRWCSPGSPPPLPTWASAHLRIPPPPRHDAHNTCRGSNPVSVSCVLVGAALQREHAENEMTKHEKLWKCG
jgi:hypothetical protein